MELPHLKLKMSVKNQVDTYFWKKKPQAKPIIYPQTKEAQIVKILLTEQILKVVMISFCEILARKTNKLSIFLEPIQKTVLKKSYLLLI